MFKKVVIGSIIFILFCSTLFFGGTTYFSNKRLGKCRSELEQVREELATARDRQSEITDLVGRTNLILSESISTVQELREQMQYLRTFYTELENICINYHYDASNGDSHINNGDSE